MSDFVGGRVRLTIDGPAATITLANPSSGNALDLAMARALIDAVSGVRDAGVKVVRLEAEGRAFSVGGDLAEFGAAPALDRHVGEVVGAAHQALTMLRELSAVVVTVVQGVAAGGGLGLALAGDVVLIARSARLRVAYTAAGLSPDCGVSYHLARALGPARALDLALTNRAISADEAYQWGLVSRVVEDENLAPVADEVVSQLAGGAAAAAATTKSLVRDAVTAQWTAQLAAEAAAITSLAATSDAREGIDAFLGKRPPVFRREASVTPPVSRHREQK